MASDQAREAWTTTLSQIYPCVVVEWFAIVGFFNCVEKLCNFGDVLRGHVSLDFELDHDFRLSILRAVLCSVAS